MSVFSPRARIQPLRQGTHLFGLLPPTLRHCPSALFRRDRKEGGWLLHHLLTAAIGTGDFLFVVVRQGQHFGEGFVTLFTEEFVERHAHLHCQSRPEQWFWA